MGGEAETAFYKGVKFWFVLLLAALLALLLWRYWRGDEGDTTTLAQVVSNIR